MTPAGFEQDTQAGGNPDAAGIGRKAVSLAILSLLAVALALTVTLLVFAAYQYRSQVIAEAEHRSIAITRLLEEHAAKTLSMHAATLSQMEWMVDDLGWERIDSSPLLHERLKAMASQPPEVLSYWVIDDGGRIRASSFEWPLRPLDASDREYFRALKTPGVKPGGSIHIGPRLSGKMRGEIFFTISRRMELPDHQFQGVAQISLRPNYFADFYRSVLHGSRDVILLMREDGEVLVRNPLNGPPDRIEIGHFPDLITTPDKDGFFRAVTPLDGIERIMTRRKIPDMPVYVLYGTDVASIEKSWRDRVLPYALFAIPALGLLCLLGVIALRRSRQAAEAQEALSRANAALEDRIAERTCHLDRALADKEMLLRDIHHRVKNNLQVILSLLELQAQRAPELEAPFSEALTRINTMGLIHEQIYRSTGVSAIRLDNFVEALAGHLNSFHSRPGRTIVIRHRVEPVSLDLNRVVPFALILNEVVSNAFKHAFADRCSGTIDIAVTAYDGSLHLTVEDDGTGALEPEGACVPDRRSMGMDLIRAFTRQIRGEYRFTRDGGTRFDLVFPQQDGDDA
ncbi:sensor histidine kinase [Azospirillum endophyticum]